MRSGSGLRNRCGTAKTLVRDTGLLCAIMGLNQPTFATAQGSGVLKICDLVALAVAWTRAIGELVRCTDGSWMGQATAALPRWASARRRRGAHRPQPCSCSRRGGHTTWACLECDGVMYAPPLTSDCRVLAGPAAVRWQTGAARWPGKDGAGLGLADTPAAIIGATT